MKTTDTDPKNKTWTNNAAWATSAKKVHGFRDNIWNGCTHRDVTEVAKWGAATFYAGSEKQVNNHYTEFDLFISLNDTPVESALRLIAVSEEIEQSLPVLRSARRDKPQIIIDWKDFASAPMPPKFFFDLLEQLKSGPPRKIAVYCMGGHGRTGTFISLLYHAMGKKDVVSLVRSVYCDKSVETREQLDWLCSAGCDIGEAKPSYKVFGKGAKLSSSSPACLHDTCPWDFCVQTKKGTQAKGSKGSATNPKAPAREEGGRDTNESFVVCQKPFNCVYESGDPYCVHCGTHRDDLLYLL